MSRKKPDPKWDHVYKSNYQSKLLSWRSWSEQAEGLLNAAELLVPEVEAVWQSHREWAKDPANINLKSDAVISIHLMLVAFSVENLLKAALVHKNYYKFDDEFRQKGELPESLKKHNLSYLAKKVGFSFTTEDEGLLRRLTRAAIWYGRYPVPMTFQDMSGSEEFSDGKTWSVSHRCGNDVARLQKLVSKIRSDLKV